jgi:hypothetical protein
MVVQKSSFKKIMVAFITGAFLGGVLTTWLAPRLISWWAEPPAFIGVSCRPAIEWAFHRFEWMQTIGLIGGGTLTLVLYLMFFRRRDRSEVIG